MARFWTSRRARTVGFALLAGVAASLPPAIAARTVTHAAGGSSGRLAAWAQAWPMVGHDPQRTYRSASIGPLHPQLIFSSGTDVSNPLIGPDGSLYGWGYNTRTRAAGLMALTALGRQRWTAPLSQIEGGPPALTPQGLALANGRDASGQAIIALTMDSGHRSWTVHALPWTTGIHSVPNSKAFAPLVTADGLLYMPFVGPDLNGHGDNRGQV